MIWTDALKQDLAAKGLRIVKTSEWERLESEVVRLSGKSGFCLSCEAYAKKIKRLEKELSK